ncbi:Vegetative incompatibility protein HET-E-1 [Diaporthe eres]|nr:Vegetative incompatibility protein HET-E-1 [Diaporthe eres]
MMHFLNTETFKLHGSTDPPPSYSVFFHAHGSDDIGFEDFSNPEMLPRKAGFNRLRQACSRARKHGSKWLWSDAVCIDRGSTAALTDAFNSLARIYQDCTFSLIYLEDLPPGDCNDGGLAKGLANCAWLRNVWVLPQLIFPKRSFIYDRDWTEIGTKASLARQLSLVTSIEQSVLINPAALGQFSIAKRISWASQLDASRPEDRAFALLGILGVHMPIIYGEGHMAFTRLQEEILRDTTDYSLFAWRPEVPQEYRGLLAYSPAEFQHFHKGPNGPFHIRGEVQPISAGIIIHAHFHKVDHDIVLPLENTEGFMYSIRLSKSGQGFVRNCSTTEIGFSQFSWLRQSSGKDTQIDQKQQQERGMGQGVVLRVCVKRDMTTSSCGTAREPQTGTRCSVHEPLSPVDSVMSSPWESPCHYSHTPTSSHDVNSKSLFDPETNPQEGFPAKLSQGMGQIEHPETSMAATQAESIGEVEMHSCCGLDCERRIEVSKWVHASADCENSGVLYQSRRSSVSTDGISLAAAISTPRTLDAEHPFFVAVPILADLLIERFHSQPSKESWKRSRICQNTQGRKSPSLSYCESYVDVQQTLDSENFDTPVVQHMRERDATLACPFYLRDKESHRTCLTRYQLRNMDDVREHLWAVHRQPVFCPACGQTFSKTTDCNDHIRSRICTPQSSLPTFEGVTISHIQELARQADLPLSMQSRWLAMWGTIFPHTETPSSWLYTTEDELRVCALREFWSRHRHSIMESVLETEVLQVHALSDEGEVLEELHNTVLNEAIDKILRCDECV